MVYVVLVYLVLLLLLLRKRNGALTMTSAIVMLFLLSVVCGVFIDIWDLYGEYGVNDKTVSLSATVVFCLGIWVLVLPFMKLDRQDVQCVVVGKKWLLDGLCWLFVLAFVVNLAVKGTDIISALIEDAASVKSEHYEDLDAIAQEEGQPIYMYLINMLIGCWSLALCLWFYHMIFCPKGVVLNVLLLLSSLGGIFNAFVTAGRAAIVYWLFVFFLYFFFFNKFMPLRQRRRIMLASLLFGGVVLVIFLIITFSRFDSTDSGTLHSLVGYAGQMYNNFCSVYEVRGLFGFTTERVFPLTNKYLFGGSFDLLAFYDRIYSQTGVSVNCFTTIFGGLVINIGLGGMVCFMLAYNLIFYKLFKTFDAAIGIHHLIILSVAVLIPAKGMFGLPFSSVSDSLVLIFSTLLYVLFKYRLKKAL